MCLEGKSVEVERGNSAKYAQVRDQQARFSAGVSHLSSSKASEADTVTSN